MKVVLINPPRVVRQVPTFPPVGLAYIGAAARQAGHRVRILDAAAWSWDELHLAVQREAPEAIGITCWTIERGQAFRAALVAKEAAPGARLIMGGPHATAFPEHMFERARADYVVLGEGEETIQELLDAMATDGDISRVRGIAYQAGGECRRTEMRPFIGNLDALPMPLHAEFDYGYYTGLLNGDRRAAAIITSRGCPFRCSFCSSTVYWGNRYRKRSVENILAEIDFLYREHGIRDLLFFDDNLIIDRQRTIALCEGLCAMRMDLVWAAEGSVKVDPELLSWMKRAGCYRIDFGVESGSPRILRNIRKSFTVEDTRTAFRLTKEAGIRPNAYLVVGCPGETRETINETIRLMKEIQPDSYVKSHLLLWILPGTEIYELSKRQGIISDRTWLETDDTLYYTGEHSVSELEALERQLCRGKARNAGWGTYLRELRRQAHEILPQHLWFLARLFDWALRAVAKLFGGGRRLMRVIRRIVRPGASDRPT